MEDNFTASQARAKSYDSISYAMSRRMHSIIKRVKAASEVGEFCVTADSLTEPVLGDMLRDNLESMGYTVNLNLVSWEG